MDTNRINYCRKIAQTKDTVLLNYIIIIIIVYRFQQRNKKSHILYCCATLIRMKKKSPKLYPSQKACIYEEYFSSSQTTGFP